MKILQLEIQGVKRIRAAHIEPATGKPVILTGDNAQGKSSILDAIVEALQNKGLADPIQHGRTKGTIKICLGQNGEIEYEILRSITRKGSYLTVRDATGNKVQSPQKFLDDLIGAIAFDPHEFARIKDSKRRRELLMEITGLNLSTIDESIKAAEEKRKLAKKAKADAEATLKNTPAAPAGTPDEAPSFEAVTDEYQELQEKARERKRLMDDAEPLKASIAALEEQIAAKKAELKANEETLAATKWPTVEEIDAKRAEGVNLNAIADAVRAKHAHEAADLDYKAKLKAAAAAEKAVETTRAAREEAISNAKMPIEGLELADDDVLYNGVIFEQLSTAEQVRVSFAIAVAQNPTLRVALIREGALMNRESWGWMDELCASEDFQLWIEKFQEDPGDVGFHIEDGEIAYVDGKEIEKSAPEPEEDPETASDGAQESPQADSAPETSPLGGKAAASKEADEEDEAWW